MSPYSSKANKTRIKRTTPLSVPKKVLFYAILALSIYPIYLKGSISIALILCCATAFIYALFNFKKIAQDKIIFKYIVFILALTPGMLLTTDFSYALKMFLICLLPLFILIAGKAISQLGLERILSAVVYVGLPIAIMNIFFWVNPSAELLYLKSSIAPFLIDPQILRDYLLNGGGNIADPAKSGTLFINTNNASVMFCILIVISVFLFAASRKKRFIPIILLYFLSELGTGCRAGLLSLMILALVLSVVAIVRSKSRIATEALVASGVLIILILMMLVVFFPEALGRLSVESVFSDVRFEIWGYALGSLPLYGVGFDGWDFLKGGIQDSYASTLPLHNHFLIVFSWGGLIALAGYCYFWFGILVQNVKVYHRKASSPSILLVCVAVLVLIHGCFDNYFLANFTLMVFVFVLIGSIGTIVQNDMDAVEQDSLSDSKSVRFSQKTGRESS